MTNNQLTKILYVDDEPINLQLFEISLRGKYNILTANSAIEGLELLNNNQETKVIISDMKMPGINGIEFIKIAKKKYPDKKFYILTGFEITAEIKQALDSGLIIKYFSKPFNLKEIDESISSILKD